MKWAYLVVALVGTVPLAGWLRRNPNWSPVVWNVVGFLVLQHGPLHLYMSMKYLGGWPGYTHGAEISLVDLIIFGIYLSLPRGQYFVPFKGPMVFYLATVLLSVLQTKIPNPTLYYAWQVCRVFFFYAVVTKACEDPRVPAALLKGMAFGLLLAAGEAVWERFGLGILRTHGGFSQENFFGVVSHFIIFPFFALLLAGERGWLPPTISLSGIIIAILTVSRAAVAFSGLGYAIMFIMSMIRRWTSRKGVVLALSAAAILALSPLFISSFTDRFGNHVESSFAGSDETRIALAHAASMVLADHPMGVGANQFVFIANTQGYYARAGVTWNNFDAIVHNAYWLVAAETGYLGLIAFIILLLRPMIVALRCGWRTRGDMRGDLLLGLGIALLTVYLHSFYEWIFVTFQIEYIFAAATGLIAGLAQQLGYWSSSRVVQAHRLGDSAKTTANTVTNHSHRFRRHQTNQRI